VSDADLFSGPAAAIAANAASGVPSFDPAFVALCHREASGQPIDAALLYRVLRDHRSWRAHVVAAMPGPGAAAVRALQREDVRARIGSGGLLEFIRGGWGEGVENRHGGMVDGLPVIPGGWAVLEPVTAFVSGRHIELLARLIEAMILRRGEIWETISAWTDGQADMIVNIPPGYMKSLIANVFTPAWVWGDKDSGTSRWIFWTYASDLTIRDSRKCRSLIESEWYRWLYPEVELSDDQNQKGNFATTRHGARISLSVDGLGTGAAGNHVMMDDPHNAQAATYSDTVRNLTIENYRTKMVNRQRPPNSGMRMLIMQRLHEEDLTGYLLRTGRWFHVCLPTHYDPEHPYLCPFDWRTKKGELLWPELFPEKRVKMIEAEMESDDIIAGQHEQLPTGKTGSIFKREHIRYWPVERPLPRFHLIVESWDPALKEKQQNDPTAMTTWGVFTSDSGRPAVMLVDALRRRMSYPELREEAVRLWNRSFGAAEGIQHALGAPLIKPDDWDDRHVERRDAGRQPDFALIEEKASGIPFLQDLQRAGIPAQGYDPGRLDKVARANAVSHFFKNGLIYVVGVNSNGKWRAVDWAEEVIREWISFPKGMHDDYTDTTTQALAVLRDLDMLRIHTDPSDDADDGFGDRAAPPPAQNHYLM